MGDQRDQNPAIPRQNGQRISSDFEVPKKPKRNKYAFMAAILASMASILLGYDLGVMSGAAIYIKEDFQISDVKVEVLVGVISLYSLVGSAAAGRTSDWIGRRYTMVLAGIIFLVGAILMGFATNYAFLMFGRFVAGVGVGYALMISPVYTAEISPASSRGFLTSFPEVFINFGIMIGYISNYAFSKLPLHLGWRFMLGISAIPSIFLAIVVLTMPESPRWLVMQGQIGKAKIVLEKTSDSIEEAIQRLSDIKEAVGIPLTCTNDVVSVPKRHNNGNEVWKELFLHPTRPVRHIVISAVCLHFFQQASGVDAVVLYSPTIFGKAGITSYSHKLLATVAVGFSKTVFILVATFLLDKIGRRKLLLTSIAGKMTSLILLGFGLTVVERSQVKVTWAVGLCIAMVLSDVAFFSIGMGPIAWVYGAEIFPLRLRAQGASAGAMMNRLTSGVVTMTFLSLSKALTIGGAFFLYAGIAAVSWVFFYVVFPETQGRSLEDIEGLFGNILWIFSKERNGDRDRNRNGGIELEKNGQV